MDRRRKTTAFTLVELLVVIAIIGVLVSLLLPAVNAAREAARRTQCMNNTRQIGLAILNHESAQGIFPSGGVTPWPRIEDYSAGGRAFGAEKQGLSWAFQILPYMEEGAISGLTTTAQIAESPVAMYFCPSRRAPTFVPASVLASAGGPVGPINFGAWLIDYAAFQPIPVLPDIAENIWNSVMVETNGVPSACRIGFAYWGRVGPGTNGGAGMDFTPASRRELGAAYAGFNGVIVRSSYLVSNGTATNLGYDKVTRTGKIKDGMSKTAMVGEKFLTIRDYASNIAIGDDRGWSDGWDLDTISHAICPPQQDTAPQNVPPELGYGKDTAPGSAHAGGFNVVYGDGAVHFLRFGIDPLTLNYIAHRSDGRVFDEND